MNAYHPDPAPDPCPGYMSLNEAWRNPDYHINQSSGVPLQRYHCPGRCLDNGKLHCHGWGCHAHLLLSRLPVLLCVFVLLRPAGDSGRLGVSSLDINRS